jgi:Transcriptional regulators
MIISDDRRAEVFELFAILAIKPRKRLEARLSSKAGLTFPQFGALLALSTRAGASQRELADAMETDRTTAMVICDGLERKGLLLRRRTEDDRRSYRLELSAAGKRALKKAGPAALATFAPLFEELSDEDCELLLPILKRLRDREIALAK